MARPDLHVVPAGQGSERDLAPPEPEAMLADLVPELIRAEETAAALQGLVDSWRRKLAQKRGVAFIRDERVRQEFGS
jgi:hypothetical protein